MNKIILGIDDLLRIERTGLVDISEFYTYHDPYSNRHCLAARFEMEQFFSLAAAIGFAWSGDFDVINSWADYNYNDPYVPSESTEYYWVNVSLNNAAQIWLDDNRG